MLEVEEIKSLPPTPMSHPFFERLIGSIRRELLGDMFFGTVSDMESKLRECQRYCNECRCHASWDGGTPVQSVCDGAVDIGGV